MNIRKYQEKDKNALIQLLRLNTPAYFAHEEEKDFVFYLENFVENHYVLEIKHEIVACGGFNFSEDLSFGKISWDIVHPDFQGKGLGSKLLAYRIAKLREYETVKMISVRTSQLVFRFYEKFGFNLKEIAQDYWAEGFDMYRMELAC